MNKYNILIESVAHIILAIAIIVTAYLWFLHHNFHVLSQAKKFNARSSKLITKFQHNQAILRNHNATLEIINSGNISNKNVTRSLTKQLQHNQLTLTQLKPEKNYLHVSFNGDFYHFLSLLTFWQKQIDPPLISSLSIQKENTLKFYLTIKTIDD